MCLSKDNFSCATAESFEVQSGEIFCSALSGDSSPGTSGKYVVIMRNSRLSCQDVTFDCRCPILATRRDGAVKSVGLSKRGVVHGGKKIVFIRRTGRSRIVDH